jgi:hypothetical protein
MTQKLAGKSSPKQPEALFRPFQYRKLDRFGWKRFLWSTPLLSFSPRDRIFLERAGVINI